MSPDAVAAAVASAGHSGSYGLAAGEGPPWRAVFQLSGEDRVAVGQALVLHLRNQGYDARVTYWR